MTPTKVTKSGMTKEVTQIPGFKPTVKKVQTNELSIYDYIKTMKLN